MPVSLDKIRETAPGLVDLAKTAAVSLEKNQLAGSSFAVYLVLDHSGSMRPHYARGHVQRLAEQALALAVNLDDDGEVPAVYFGSRAERPITIDLANYDGIVGATHRTVSWGSTDYVAAMRMVTAHYQASGAADPALVIFQTDGNPNDQDVVEQYLREVSNFPVFWAFVGFGTNVSFLQRLDYLDGRAVDNASFFRAADPDQVSDADVYDGLTRELPAWMDAARIAGILH